MNEVLLAKTTEAEAISAEIKALRDELRPENFERCEELEQQFQALTEEIADLRAAEKAIPEELKELKGHVFAEFKLEAMADNSFKGIANMLGIMDRGGDVMAPGCFGKAVIDSFLQKGFVPLSHDWDANPIAMPTSAKEVAADGMRALEIGGEFHSTAEAQDTRTVVLERMARGLFCGLSVGFVCDRDSVEWFESGAALWKRLEDDNRTEGHDAKTIRAWKGYCRYVRKVAELFEVSIVTVPMNQASAITAAKAHEKVSPGDSAPAAAPLRAHLESVRAAAEDLVTRCQGLKALRDGDGREIGEERKQQMREVGSVLYELGAQLNAIGAETPKFADEAARLLSQAQHMAALAGV